MDNLEKLSKKELVEWVRSQQANPVQSGVSNDSHESELDKIDKLAAASNPHQIPFRETSDHKNVMLYTAINKRVGPLHPDNARRTMQRWKRAGVQLFTSPRTPEQVEAFKQTEEYQVYQAKHLHERKLRRSQSTKGRTEKMIEEISKATAAAVAGARK